ncbi:DNA cytosine methyltransferase [Synechocystis sp. PCC 7509]
MPRTAFFILDYVKILQYKQPLFFLAENVSGILHKKYHSSIENIVIF